MPEEFVPEPEFEPEPEQEIKKPPTKKPKPMPGPPPAEEYSEYGEAAVLGGMIIDPKQIQGVEEVLKETDFYLPSHKIIFRGITSVNKGGAFDLVLLRDWLERHRLLKDVGGKAYLEKLANCVPSAANTPYYVNIVWDFAKHRQLKEQTAKAGRIAADPDASLAEKEKALKDLSANPQADPEAQDELVFIDACNIVRKEMKWLIPDKIPADAITLIVGNGEAGKSWIITALVAMFTTGRGWPAEAGQNTHPPGRVLIFNDEDRPDTVIVPHLEDNGANMELVSIYDCVRGADGSKQFYDTETRASEFERYLDIRPDAKIVIFDPITAYLGRAKENSNSEVRAALAPINEIAQKRGVTVIGVTHLNKKIDMNIVDRTLGSSAFKNVARACWAVIHDKDEDGEPVEWRKFISVKNNYAPKKPPGFQFKIVNSVVEFDDAPCYANADDSTSGQVPAALNEAKEFLEDVLGDGREMLSTDITAEGKKQGLSNATIDRASKKLPILKRKSPLHIDPKTGRQKSIWKMKGIKNDQG
jgi:hypothetical protein